MWIACVAVFVCYQDYKITKMGEGNLHPRRPPREYLSEYTSLDTGDLSMLTLLDLSAAFDTVDHQILIRRLETSYGLGGVVLSWFKSYLDSRTQYVRCGRLTSTPATVIFGVPQGSVRFCSCSTQLTCCD